MDFINFIKIKIKNLLNKGWYGRFKNINFRNKKGALESLLRKCPSSSNLRNIKLIEKSGYLDEKDRKHKWTKRLKK
jgi:hypothetical protein